MPLADYQTLDIVAKFIAIIGGTASLAFGAYQLLVNTRINRARFWLELRRMFAEHNEVHRKLRPLGAWHQSMEHPTPEELPEVEAYMGLLEHCNDMMEQKLIDWETFNGIYGYRVTNIMSNRLIVKAKLVDNAQGWERFIWLVNRRPDWQRRLEEVRKENTR